MTAPDPAARLLGREREQRRRLRVVHDADVPAAGQLARVHLVVLRPRAPLLLGEVLRVALQRVVHQLRRVEELLAAVDHLPLDLEPDVAHQRHERVEDLRHAAAERGRREMDHPLALQRLGELAHLLDQRPADDVRVVREALACEGDRLEHRRRDDTAEAGRPPGQPPSGSRCSGRSPSSTSSSRRSPPRQTSIGTFEPGSISATASERSSGFLIGAPVELRDHVAAGEVLTDLERRLLAAPAAHARPRRPGCPPVSSWTQAPSPTGRSKRSRSCG